MTLSHERCSSDMQFRQQITWCWLQKKSIIKSGCLEHFACVVSTSPGKADMASMSMTWWLIEALLQLCAFTQFIYRASSQSTHHLVAGVFSSFLEHGSQLVFDDMPKVKANHIWLACQWQTELAVKKMINDRHTGIQIIIYGSNSGIQIMTYDSNSVI